MHELAENGGQFMKYTVTSAEASKMLKKIIDEKNITLNNERQSSSNYA